MAQLTGMELLRIRTTVWLFELATRGTRNTITSTWRELRETQRELLIQQVPSGVHRGGMSSPTQP